MSGDEKLKVLLDAYVCEPNRGSEPGVGWNWTLQLAKKHKVTVLTWEACRQHIEKVLPMEELADVRFEYYELPRWARFFARSQRMHYFIWQMGVLAKARRLQKQNSFDIVHHLTFNTVEGPGLLWSLDAPFVWGPVGGGQVPPKELKSYFRHVWAAEIVRSLRKWSLRINPFVRMAARNSACLLVANEDTAKRLERFARVPMVKACETAVRVPPEPRVRPADDVYTISWWANMQPRKGPLLALDVAQELKNRGLKFRMVMGGDGPWLDVVTRQWHDMKLEDCVDVVGYVTYEGMNDLYEDGDVFLFSSLQDTSGNVVLEAMSHARPVVCLDQHGAAEIVTDETGIKIQVKSQKQVVDDMATAMQRLAADPELRRSLGEGGRKRILERYTWDRKADLADYAYAIALEPQKASEMPLPALVGTRRGSLT